MRYARACIECDVTQPLPDKVWIYLPNGKSYWQEVVVERSMKYCAHCRIHGHELNNCRKRKQKTVSIDKENDKEKNEAGKNEMYIEERSNIKEGTCMEYGPDILYRTTVLKICQLVTCT